MHLWRGVWLGPLGRPISHEFHSVSRYGFHETEGDFLKFVSTSERHQFSMLHLYTRASGRIRCSAIGGLTAYGAYNASFRACRQITPL